MEDYNRNREILFQNFIINEFPIPTQDNEIKMMLRDLCQPIIYFGESLLERRERLKKEVEKQIKNNQIVKLPNSEITSANFHYKLKNTEVKCENKENIDLLYTNDFYTLSECPEDLIIFRKKSLESSLSRSKNRIETQKKDFFKKSDLKTENIRYELLLTEYLKESQGIKDIDIDKDNSYIGVSTNSGDSFIYKLNFEVNFNLIHENLIKISILKGHQGKINSLKFNKVSNFSTEYAPIIATGSDDKTIKIWSFDSKLKYQMYTSLYGHMNSITEINFSKIDYYLGSVSKDCTFRLWDLEKKKTILVQDGHLKSITSLDFQNDGSLSATSDSSGIGCIWDLRYGKKAFSLEGHTDKINKIKFLNNSYQVITAGDDHTIRLWDLRKNGNVSILPAHFAPIKALDTIQNIVISGCNNGLIKVWDINYFYNKFTFDFGDINKINSVKITSDLNNIILSTNESIKILRKTNE